MDFKRKKTKDVNIVTEKNTEHKNIRIPKVLCYFLQYILVGSFAITSCLFVGAYVIPIACTAIGSTIGIGYNSPVVDIVVFLGIPALFMAGMLVVFMIWLIKCWNDFIHKLVMKLSKA